MDADSFTFVATGDAILGHSVTGLAGEDEQFDELLSVLRPADATLTQLEPVGVEAGALHASLPQVSDQYQYLSPFPGAIMGTAPERLDDLSAMGIDLYTAASNHAYDFGPEGVQRTLSSMRERTLPVAGIGEDHAAARSPSYLETPGGRVGIVDATTSVPPGGEAGVSTPEFEGAAGVSPLHVEWTYRVPETQLEQLRRIAERTGIEAVKGEWLRRENPDWADDDAYYFLQMRFAAATEARPPGIYQSIRRRDREAVLGQVRESSANADWVVLGVHAHQSAEGNRNTSATPPFLRRLARDAVDTGPTPSSSPVPTPSAGSRCTRSAQSATRWGTSASTRGQSIACPTVPTVSPTGASPTFAATAPATTASQPSPTTPTTGAPSFRAVSSTPTAGCRP
jgi:poly-gamma-glutamate synthesis protein (capsule biosynthesis protein)